jgi:fatty acid-binding protein DegV
VKSLVAEYAPLQKLSILYTTDEIDAQEIANEVASYAPDGEPVVAQLGPVVGNYLGPGTLGLGFIRAESS